LLPKKRACKYIFATLNAYTHHLSKGCEALKGPLIDYYKGYILCPDCKGKYFGLKALAAHQIKMSGKCPTRLNEMTPQPAQALGILPDQP
jgi:hypothetical protein